MSYSIEVLASKIEKEGNIEKIGSCVSDIADVSEDVALKLVDVVSSRIEKEKDIGKVKLSLWDIGRANVKVNQEIVKRLNPELREELQKNRWLK